MVMPSGIGYTTGCEYPKSVQTLSLHRGAVTDADDGHALLETLVTPSTMLFTSARVVPDHGVGKGRVVIRGNVDHLALVGQLDLRVDIGLEAALRPS